jgi:xanthine/uracil permease
MEDEEAHMMGVTEVLLTLCTGLVTLLVYGSIKHFNVWFFIVVSILFVLSAIFFVKKYREAPIPMHTILIALIVNGILSVLITFL